MTVTGRPATGVRYVLERAAERADAIVYRGFAHLPEADVPLEVVVALPGGATRAAVTPPEGVASGVDPRELERVAAALVRSATKPAVAEGGSGRAPRKIARWRGPG